MIVRICIGGSLRGTGVGALGLALLAAPALSGVESPRRVFEARLASAVRPSKVVVSLERRASVRFDSFAAREDEAPIMLWDIEGRTLAIEFTVENTFDLVADGERPRFALVSVTSELCAGLDDGREIVRRKRAWSACAATLPHSVEIEGIAVPREVFDAGLTLLDVIPSAAEWGRDAWLIECGTALDLGECLGSPALDHDAEASSFAAPDAEASDFVWLATPQSWLASARASFVDDGTKDPLEPALQARIEDIAFDPSARLSAIWSRMWRSDRSFSNVLESDWTVPGRARLRVSTHGRAGAGDGFRLRAGFDSLIDARGEIITGPTCYPARFELEVAALVHVDLAIGIRAVSCKKSSDRDPHAASKARTRRAAITAARRVLEALLF